jgi:2-polyprenyl-3-methyl-5-hydroxy-6-metoxy-1,4-benzoquinol methylase
MKSISAKTVEFLTTPKPSSFAEEWYDEAGADHFWMQWRLTAFLQQLRHLGISTDAPWRVLDIGGGNGVFSRQVEANTNWTVDCADLNTRALELVPPGRGRALYYDIQEPKKEYVGDFDAVFLMDVIEHIEPTQGFIEAALKHVKPGGYVFVNVPALQSLYSRYDEQVGHHRRYNKDSLAAEFKSQKVSILEQRFWGFCLIPVVWVRRIVLQLAQSQRRQTVRIGFHPPSKLINTLFVLWHRIETKVLSRPILGTSLLLVARKPS